MKKISAIIVALLIVAISAVTAFAAGINDNEQKVLDELKTSVEMQGVEMNWPAAYVNQAENYFNTIDMTSDQAEQIIAVIRSGKTQLESTGAKNIAECTAEQKKELAALFSAKDNMDEDEKVRRVLELYNTIGLRDTLEKAIDEEFRKAKEKLDAINVAETLKKPLREMMETLNGRKK